MEKHYSTLEAWQDNSERCSSDLQPKQVYPIEKHYKKWKKAVENQRKAPLIEIYYRPLPKKVIEAFSPVFSEKTL